LAHRVFQGLPEIAGVGADLALHDDAALVFVQNLNRVFDGDDVVRMRAIHVIDQAGERRAFAAAGWAGRQDQAAFHVGKIAQDLARQPERLETGDGIADHAHDNADAVALPEDIAAETGNSRQRIGEVEFVTVLELFPLFGGQQTAGNGFCVIRRERPVRKRHEFPIDPARRGAADVQVNVRGASRDHGF
jgi:hypothetical protein